MSCHCYQKPASVPATKRDTYLLRRRSCTAIPLLYRIRLLLTTGLAFLRKKEMRARKHFIGASLLDAAALQRTTSLAIHSWEGWPEQPVLRTATTQMLGHWKCIVSSRLPQHWERNRPVPTDVVPHASRLGSLTSLTVVLVGNGLLQGDRLWLFVLTSFQPFPVSGAEFAHLGVFGRGVATFSLFHLQL